MVGWLRDDRLKPCVSKSSNDEILSSFNWCVLDGLESGDIPFGMILYWCALDRLRSRVVPFGFDWCALDRLESGVVPFGVEVVGR